MWSAVVSPPTPDPGSGPHSSAVTAANAPARTDEWPLPSISTRRAGAVLAAQTSVGTAAAATAAAAAAPSVGSFWAGGRCGEATVLESGLVLIKGAVSPEEQVEMAAATVRRGDLPDPHGFRDAAGQLNSTKTRGRIYDAVTAFDGRFRELCQHVVRAARSADASMPEMDPTHLMMLFYTSASRNQRGNPSFLHSYSENLLEDTDGLLRPPLPSFSRSFCS